MRVEGPNPEGSILMGDSRPAWLALTAQLTAEASAGGERRWTIPPAAPTHRIHDGPTWPPVNAVDLAETTFKTAGRHPWRCRRTDRSRRAPAISYWASGAGSGRRY
jgi:hypothetical protein